MEEWKEKKRKARHRKKKKKKRERKSDFWSYRCCSSLYVCGGTVQWSTIYMLNTSWPGRRGVIGFFQSAISSRLLSHGRVGGRNLRVTFAFLSSPSAPSASYNSWFSTSQWEPLMPSLILCVYVCVFWFSSCVLYGRNHRWIPTRHSYPPPKKTYMYIASRKTCI